MKSDTTYPIATFDTMHDARATGLTDVRTFMNGLREDELGFLESFLAANNLYELASLLPSRSFVVGNKHM